MLIKEVSTVLTTNSAGQVVESIPVREAGDGETDSAGVLVDPIIYEEDTAGVPVRFVAGKTTLNSVGQVVASMALSQGPRAPSGFCFLMLNGKYLTMNNKRLMMENADA